MKLAALVAVIVYVVAAVWLLAVWTPDALSAREGRSTPAARAFRFPRGWLREAFCIHRHESVDWYRAGVDWTGAPSPYFGGFQFLVSTWRSVGGRELPSDWPVREQVYRAYLVWDRDAGKPHDGRGSWAEWGSRSKCRLA